MQQALKRLGCLPAQILAGETGGLRARLSRKCLPGVRPFQGSRAVQLPWQGTVQP